MKKALLLTVLLALSGAVHADKMVKGHVTKDGAYVAPHVRSSPNSYKFDNYSSKGNQNPYTGEKGYGRNEFTNPPEYNKPRQR
jgi:hypothetical protein